ncbi:TetR/AcrR family transcriptional regulator [Altererythrobacter xiamenensis]|nr:TetR/AcrR family transcriptional regulator [Altererythrobacter xiamenensis]
MRAAASHFSKAEFSDVSMDAIAAEAGLTGAAIYNHFASKDALFIATAVHMTRTNLQTIEQAIAEQEGWRDQLRAVLMLYVDDQTGWFQYPMLTPAVQLKMLRNRDDYSEMLSLRRDYAAQFEKIIAGAIAEGDLPDHLPIALAGQLMVAFIYNGMGTVLSHRGDDVDVQRIVDATAVMLGGTVSANRSGS